MKVVPPVFWAFLMMPILNYSQNIGPPKDHLQADKRWFKLVSSNPASEIRLLHSDTETSRFEIITGGFWKETIRTADGNPEIKVFTDNSTPIMIPGAPDLDKITVSLAIPDRANMQISIVEEEFTDLTGISIIPSKGNLTRDINPEDVPYEYGREYTTDAFFPGVVAELRAPHIIRDVRGQVAVIYPFRYNPVQKTLRVYTRLVIEVKNTGGDGENILSRQNTEQVLDRAFEGIYNRNFLNYSEYRGAERYTPLEDDGNMLIISYGPFIAEMQEFVEWKNMSGIPTEIVDVSSIGSAPEDIKAFVANYYNEHGLTFLLLVGDAAQVPPSSTTAGVSDNDYSYIVGNDHYPDIFIGRFSAETNAQVETQVHRTLDYEKEPGAASGFFGRAMCIASSHGPGDDDELDWVHQRNIRSDYLDFTYTSGSELYDGSQGGADAPGNPTSAMVANEINSGVGIISYTGHGSVNAWTSSGFSSNGVNNLSNNDKLPFIFSVACVNGDFANYTCFAEAWLRATRYGQPSGAIATIMSTINQSWNPPMCGQDEMVDILVESYPSNIRRTFGGICMNGCMNMNDVYGIEGYDMTDTWTVFGDPSLMVRTSTPVTMTVSHDGNMPVGANHLTVYCNQENARVAISNDYQLLATGFINAGSAILSIDPVYTADTLTVTVTAFNCIPAIDSLIITDADMTYISCTAFHKNLGQVGPGEQDAEVLGVKLIMSGSLDPLHLESLIFNMNGTTSLSDVSGVSAYYTGNSPDFDTSLLFGSSSVSGGPIRFLGTQVLAGGCNYFWLAYDLNESAIPGNFIDAECSGLTISDNSITKIPAVTAPAGAREIQLMELSSLNTTQYNVQQAFRGDQAVEIICIEIVTLGSPQPLQVNSVLISTDGTTDLADVSNIKIYYTSDGIFTTDDLFGSANPDDTLMIIGSKVLSVGSNYLWITYDLSTVAEPGNQLDAECLEVVFDGNTGIQVPDVTDPDGFRVIELNYCIPTYTYGTSYGDFISLVGLAALKKSSSASSSPYYTFYQDVTTHLVTDSTYKLVVSAGTYSTGNIIAAWIDFNRNGTFETIEKLGEVSVPAMPVTGTISFVVPPDAFIGSVRMRVREVWSTTGVSPCMNYLYGETEDYQVRIMKPGYWLGFTNEWNNPANWSNGVVPGHGSQVTIPEVLMGNYYPSDFTGANASIEKLIMEEGSHLDIPAGVMFKIGK